jgi:hypothetical protein
VQNAGGANSVVHVMAPSTITTNDIGVQAGAGSAGTVNVTTDAGSTINQGTNGGVQNTNVAGPLGGIVTLTADGTNTISNGATINAAANGVSATSTTGNISVTGAGNITAGNAVGDFGITASAAGGNVTVGPTGTASASMRRLRLTEPSPLPLRTTSSAPLATPSTPAPSTA